MKFIQSEQCLCCDSRDIKSSPAVLMPFVAHRIFGYEPIEIDATWELQTIKNGVLYTRVNSLCCQNCGFLFLDLRFTENQTIRLYDNYRDKNYEELRDSYEPGYKKRNSNLVEGINYLEERESFIKPFLGSQDSLNILDWGGNDGLNTPFNRKHNNIFLYDPSEVKSIDVDKIRKVNLNNFDEHEYDLIVCNHVLEHVTYPDEVLNNFKKVLLKGGHIYLEVPRERLVAESNSLIPDYIKKRHWHEHINFFTEKSLIKLFEKTDLNICSIELSNTDAPGNFDSFWKIILN